MAAKREIEGIAAFQEISQSLKTGMTLEEVISNKDRLLERTTTVADYLEIRLRLGEIRWKNGKLTTSKPIAS